MRVKLLSKAIANAKVHAEAIALESGHTVEMWSIVSSRAVQVLPKGGIDISD